MKDFFRKLFAKKETTPEIFNKKGRCNNSVQLLMNAVGNDKNVLTFLHNTKDESVAKKIISDGFSFISHLEYTTDLVTIKDPLTVEYFNLSRRMYGAYTIIIQISKGVVKKYSQKLKNNSHYFYEVLTLHEPETNEDGDKVYVLAPYFIKGYVDNNDGQVYLNPDFDSSKNLPRFDSNVEHMLK